MPDNIAVIKLAAKHGKLHIVKDYIPATETVNGVKIEIDFRSDEWNDLAKTVGFYVGEDAYGQILEGDSMSCFVPWEVLDSGLLTYYVNVVGISSDLTLTTNRIRLRINLGGYKDLINASEPTPTLYEQLLGMMQKIDPSNYVPLTDGLMQQQLMASNPTEDMHIATKQYVDEKILENISSMDAGRIIERS